MQSSALVRWPSLPFPIAALAYLWLVFRPTLAGASADWEAGPGYRSFQLTAPASGQAGFTLLSADITGIAFSNTVPESVHLTNQILLNGSGVAAGDIDGDGRCDLYFCALHGRNALYRNLGNRRFEDITEQAGVGCAGLRSLHA